MRTGYGWSWMSLLVGLAACQDACPQQLTDTRATPSVTPATLDFQAVDVSQRTTRSFTLRNAGDRPYDELTFALSADTDPAFSLGATPTSVPALGGSRTVEVSILPRVATTFAGKVLIRGRVASEGAAEPLFQDFEVELRAVAVNNGLPDIEVDPVAVDFGRVGMNDVARQTITIRNAGIRDLIVEEVELDADPSGPFFCAQCASLRTTLAPTASVSVEVVFTPDGLQTYEGVLHVRSIDPDEPDVVVTLTGGGQEAPVACIEFLDDLSMLRPQGTVRMDGACSRPATSGAYLATYEWDYAYRAPGSTTTLESVIPGNGGPRGVPLVITCPDPADTAAIPCSTRVDTVADVAGTYQVSLVVVDSLGIRSAPATVEFRAIPEEALHIQLVWDHPTADFDLHFMRNTGPPFNHASDCYFSNRFPTWWGNTAMDPRNPRLDVDDQGGFGPENVNVIAPEPGPYRIAVHYWSDKTDGDPSALATLRVYVRGQLKVEQGQFFSRDQELWNVVDMEWPVDPQAEPEINPIQDVVPYPRPF